MTATGMVRKPFTPETVEVGDFVSYTMVTDTQVYEVVAKTAKTITVRRARDGDFKESKHEGGNPYPLVWTGQVADPDAEPRVLRWRKDGTIRSHRSGNPFRFATVIEGHPVRYTDYRF